MFYTLNVFVFRGLGVLSNIVRSFDAFRNMIGATNAEAFRSIVFCTGLYEGTRERTMELAARDLYHAVRQLRIETFTNARCKFHAELRFCYYIGSKSQRLVVCLEVHKVGESWESMLEAFAEQVRAEKSGVIQNAAQLILQKLEWCRGELVKDLR